ncbi:MAG: hypothetical protein ABIJ34_09625 [archaeon]
MIDVKNVYNELLITSLVLNFFDAFLTALAAFSIFYFVAYFWRVSYQIAIVAALIFFIRSFYHKLRQNRIRVLEQEYPNLKERLRTSYDHQDSHNRVVDNLHQETLKLMEKVDVNAYLNPKRLTFKIFAVCIMLFSVLYLSSIGFDILDIKVRVLNSGIYKNLDGKMKDIFDKRDEVIDREKLDNAKFATLGNKDMNISIDTFNTELDVNDVSAPEKNDFGGHYPEEVAGAAQEVYDEKLPEEYKDTIRDYFKRVNE